MDIEIKNEYDGLDENERRRKLFLNQKQTLDLFLERGNITKAQYDKSYGDLKKKMGISD